MENDILFIFVYQAEQKFEDFCSRSAYFGKNPWDFLDEVLLGKKFYNFFT